MNSILLVESDDSTVHALTRVLTDVGYQVVTSMTILDARIAMQESLPEIVLADVHPRYVDCNGLLLAKQLRDSLGAHAPAIVLMTTDLALVSKARGEGFRVLSKPFDLASLLDGLRAELETK